MSNIVDLTLVELIDKIKKKEVSSKETPNAYIERCKNLISNGWDPQTWDGINYMDTK